MRDLSALQPAVDAASNSSPKAVAFRWAFVGLGVAIVVAAFVVNRFAPAKRRRVKRLLILYGLYLACAGAAAALHALAITQWVHAIGIAAALLEAFGWIGLAALLVFDVLLPKLRIDLVSITSDLIVGGVYVVVTFGVLDNNNLDIRSVFTAGAVIGGIITFSLQDTLKNTLGGVALQLDGSVRVGDWIQLENGRQGKVKEIRWRHTVVETRDWDTIIVPNSSLLASNITILGKREGEPVQHRMWVYFSVDFRYSPTRVIHVVEEALRAGPIEGVAAKPAPNCVCLDFAKDGRDSYAYYAVRYWLTDLPADDPTSSRVRARVFSALKRARIPLARPIRTVFFQGEEDETTRLARHHQERLAAIQHVVLFRSLTEEELDFVADHLHYAPFCAGETVTRRGAVAHWLYILVSGRVQVMASVERGPSRVVATIDAPDFFGETGLMTGEPRSADVIAETDVDCYRLDKIGFEKILHARPEIAETISQTLARRRVELDAVREGLDAEAKRSREAAEQARILGRIRDFFGLEG